MMAQSPVQRIKSYAGTPTAGDCTAATIGVLNAINTTPATDTLYDCLDVSSTPTWIARASGSGTVSNVSWTGGIVSIADPTTTPAFTIAGTSGGVPYFNSATTWATSAAGTAGHTMLWGGAGAAPTALDPATKQAADADLTAIAAITRARGTLIRGGATDWEGVALGAANAILRSDGTDAVWAALVSSSGALDFPSIADGGCDELTQTMTGAALGDVVAMGVSGTALPAKVSATVRISAADTAQYQVCNFSGAAVDLSSRTFTARVVR